jgi:hypothetical protein
MNDGDEDDDDEDDDEEDDDDEGWIFDIPGVRRNYDNMRQ